MSPTSFIQVGKPSYENSRQSKHRAAPNLKKSGGYLRYIDGLRGLAIALVVIFHVFVGKVSSGVDVFLFIGGIMLLSSQINNSSNEYGLTVFQSFIRIFRRLVPALVLVVSVTIILAMFVYPPASWGKILSDAVSSVTYIINWTLPFDGQSYATAGAEVSMFQHLWSMAAQMQIYIFIISVIYLFRFIFNRNFTPDGKEKQKKSTIILVSVLTISSLSYAIYENIHNQTLNYYSPFSRFWEIGAGALLGVILTSMVFAPVLRWIISACGFIMIFSVGMFLDGSQQFPGAWALVPILGAAMVVVSGVAQNSFEERNWKNFGFIMILETKPFQFLGKISYSLYLWHWSLLIIFVHKTGMEAKNLKVGVPVIAISLLLAWLTTKYVEQPLRQKTKPEKGIPFTIDYYRRIVRTDPPRGIVVSTVAIVVSLCIIIMSPLILKGGQVLVNNIHQKEIAEAGGWDKSYPGAAEFLYGVEAPENVPIQPDLSDIDDMMPQSQKDKCFTEFGSTKLVLNKPDGTPCAYGDVDSQKTMYIVGGSHSEQYLPALDAIAKDRGIKLIPILKMGCALYQDFKWDGTDFTECYQDWSPKAEQWIKDNPPTEGVFMVSTRPTTIEGDGPEIVPEYYIDTFKRLSDAGIKIYGVRDNPWFTKEQGVEQDVRLCVSQNQNNVETCNQEASKTLLPTNPADTAYGNINMVNIDLTKAFVKDGEDKAVIGNLLAYRDSHHLTSQFVQTLRPELEKQMFENK